MERALRDIIKAAPRREPSEEPTKKDPSDAFMQGYKYGLWVQAKRARVALSRRAK